MKLALGDGKQTMCLIGSREMYLEYCSREKKNEKPWDGIERRHDLMENLPLISFYLVSLLFMVVLISS